MKNIVLIDGNNLVHRAYHGIPKMTTSTGMEVNAVYGFITLYLKAVKALDAQYVAVLFDSETSWRKTLYPEYKAKRRSESSNTLVDQFNLIHKVCKLMNIHQCFVDTYEADDLLATYAKQLREFIKKRNLERTILIITKDKDLQQLVTKDGIVQVYDSMHDKLIGYEDVIERWKVLPHQIPIVQAIMGDKVDNITGVAGIGQMTAFKLVKHFEGDFDAMLTNKAKGATKHQSPFVVSESVINKLSTLNARGDFELSLKLASLVDDIPVNVSLVDLKVQPPNLAKLKKLLTELEMFSLFPRLGISSPAKERFI